MISNNEDEVNMENIPITSDRIEEIAESSCASQKSRKRVRKQLKESPPCKILRHDALLEKIMFKEIRAKMHRGQMWLEYKKIEVTPAFVENEMKKKFGIDIGYHKAWHAIQKVVACIRGSPEENYQILPSYLHMMVCKNPGTYTSIKRDAQNRFSYMFFAHATSVAGWSYCRPAIAVDAMLLKFEYRGVLFVVESKDANNQIFPLCFGVAESKNNEAYIWFFGEMIKAIQVHRELVFLSDRNQSIANGIRKVFSEAHHSFCLYHFEKNLKQRHAKPMVFNLDSMLFRINSEGIEFIVDLKKRTCDCLEFQLDELPCPHAIAAINKRYLQKSDYCSNWYSKETWLKTYEGHVNTVGDQKLWDIPQNVQSKITKPPDVEILQGRRQKKRHIPMTESVSFKSTKCSQCKQVGHNRTTCLSSPAPRPYSKKHTEKYSNLQ
ncbi:uncharacterized protein [Nicotiana sylvestris]|uniref:uncharacterized protein n=1 Tax=Nicotiana sylvestris TaxID=4096 RepID=UPI00388CA16E